MSVGTKITEYRKKSGITSRDLAAMLGITPATMSRYESGKILSISPEILDRMAACLGCTVDELVMDDTNYSFLKKHPRRKTSSLSQEEESLLKGYNGLTPELQDVVRRICQIGL
jgi:transcriptional regulator with XRE-family HTH domain